MLSELLRAFDASRIFCRIALVFTSACFCSASLSVLDWIDWLSFNISSVRAIVSPRIRCSWLTEPRNSSCLVSPMFSISASLSSEYPVSLCRSRAVRLVAEASLRTGINCSMNSESDDGEMTFVRHRQIRKSKGAR